MEILVIVEIIIIIGIAYSIYAFFKKRRNATEKSKKEPWTRDQKLAFTGIIVLVLFSIIALFWQDIIDWLFQVGH